MRVLIAVIMVLVLLVPKVGIASDVCEAPRSNGPWISEEFLRSATDAAKRAQYKRAISRPIPSLDHLRLLVNAEVGAHIGQDVNTTFPQTSPLELNVVTRGPRSALDAAEALLDLNVPKNESYARNLERDFNKYVSTVSGALGDAINKGVQLYKSEDLRIRGYIENTDILQCSGDLPLKYLDKLGGVLGVTQLRHIWLQMNGTSYGMPYTIDHGYFGGDAVVYSPDRFQSIFANTLDVTCTPVYQPKKISKANFSKATNCVANAITHFKDTESSTVTFLNYSVLTHNCLAAARFIVECAGGEIAQSPNLGVGGHFDWDFKIKTATISPELERVHQKIYGILLKLDSNSVSLRANPRLAKDDFASYIHTNTKVLEDLRLAIIEWLKSKPAGLRSNARFMGKEINAVYDRVSFRKFILELGWGNFYNALDQLKSDLSVGDFQQGTVSQESLSDLCDHIRQGCMLPKSNRK